MLYKAVDSFDKVSVWFCGPPAFAQCLLNGLSAYGFDQRHFHYDSFDMRYLANLCLGKTRYKFTS